MTSLHERLHERSWPYTEACRQTITTDNVRRVKIEVLYDDGEDTSSRVLFAVDIPHKFIRAKALADGELVTHEEYGGVVSMMLVRVRDRRPLFRVTVDLSKSTEWLDVHKQVLKKTIARDIRGLVVRVKHETAIVSQKEMQVKRMQDMLTRAQKDLDSSNKRLQELNDEVAAKRVKLNAL